MAVFRFLSAVAALIAVIALVSDATPWLAGVQEFAATPLAHHWDDLAPTSYEKTKVVVSKATAPWVWTYGVESIVNRSTFVVFGLLSLFLGQLGVTRRKVRLFVN